MAFKVLIEETDSLESYDLDRRPEQIFHRFSEAIRSLKSCDELLIMPGRYYSADTNDRNEYTFKAEIRGDLSVNVLQDLRIEGYTRPSDAESESDRPEVLVTIDGSIPALSNRDAWVKSTEVANTIISHEQVYVTREPYALFGTYQMAGYVEMDSRQYALVNYGLANAAKNNNDEILISEADCLKEKRDGFISNESFFWKDDGSYQPSYIGPGFYHDPESKKIYIRLDSLPAEVVGEERYYPMSFEDFFNPALDRKLFICPTGDLVIRIATDWQKDEITIKNLKFRNQTRGILALPNATNVVIDNCEFVTNQAITIGRESQNVTIRNCTFDGALPPWISWGDVKGEVVDSEGKLCMGAVSHTHNAELLVFGPGSGAGIHDSNDTRLYNKVINCHFTNCFDAIQIQPDTYDTFTEGDMIGEIKPGSVRSGASNVLVHNNTFLDVRDDCVNLGATCHHIIVSSNEMRGVGTGFALIGGRDETLTLGENEFGTIFIHHNLIECVPIYAGRIFCREGAPIDHPPFKRIGQYALQAFITTHGGVGHNFSPRKIYNNTVLLKGSTEEVLNGRDIHKRENITKISAQYSGNTPTSTVTEDRHRHEVFNNIFVQYSVLFMAVYDLSQQREFSDGNIYFRDIPDSDSRILIRLRHSDSGARPIDANTLTALQSREDVIWETHGAEGDPELDPDFYPPPYGLAANTFVSLADKAYLPEEGRNSEYCGAFPTRLPSGCIPAWIAEFMRSIVRG